MKSGCEATFTSPLAAIARHLFIIFPVAGIGGSRPSVQVLGRATGKSPT